MAMAGPSRRHWTTGEGKDRRLCKALECSKFKQGKCNGYCVVCFNQFGATTCRDYHCTYKIHEDGPYCFSHLANVDDDTNAKLVAQPVSSTKPAAEPATKKEIAAAVKPSKQFKKKREHRIRYSFPATSSHQSLRVDANSKNPKHQTILKDDLLSLVDSVLKETRHAKSSDGKSHYLLNEIRDNLNRALGPSSSHKVSRKSGQEFKDEAPIEIQGIAEETFTAEEIALMPVVFAYHEDIESEQNAKIATLDYEVEQSRLKRKAAAMDERNSGKEPVSPAEHKSNTDTEKNQTEKEPSDKFPPSGWTMEQVPRSARQSGTNSKPFDTYYYSPKLRLKFRSRPEVKRFIALLESSDNDEEKAFSNFKGR